MVDAPISEPLPKPADIVLESGAGIFRGKGVVRFDPPRTAGVQVHIDGVGDLDGPLGGSV
jgi:hypothetical protein